MKMWENLGNLIITNILKPVLGTWWAEITALIICILLTIFIIIFIVICKKHINLIENYEAALKVNADIREQTKQKDIKVKALEFDINKLKNTNVSLQNEILEKNNQIRILSEEKALLINNNSKSNSTKKTSSKSNSTKKKTKEKQVEETSQIVEELVENKE